MTLERDGERREPLQQLPPQRLREAACDADVPQLVAVVEAEQERARQRLLDEPAKAGDDAVRRQRPLHLHHRALPGLVAQVSMLRDDAFEALEPALGHFGVRRRRRQRHRRPDVGEQLLEPQPPLGEPTVAQIVVPNADEVERDERRRRLGPQPLDPRRRGMQACHQREEVELVRARDHQLSVQHEPLDRQRKQRLHDLGEVAGARAAVARPQVDLAAVAKGQAAEAVPLRLVQVLAHRQLPFQARASIGPIVIAERH
jgi:hypothetical protein